VNEFLFTVDRDPSWSGGTSMSQPAPSPGGMPNAPNQILNCTDEEQPTWVAFTDAER
jgi:hypothetical protein